MFWLDKPSEVIQVDRFKFSYSTVDSSVRAVSKPIERKVYWTHFKTALADLSGISVM